MAAQPSRLSGMEGLEAVGVKVWQEAVELGSRPSFTLVLVGVRQLC